MSLRTKMALILLVATGIPFAIGGAAVQYVVAPAYKSAVSRASEEHTQRLAEQIAWAIGLDVNRLEKLAAWAELRELVKREPLTDARAKELHSRWSALPLSSDALRPLLHNSVARELRWWRDTDAGVVEILATDAAGRLVAATGKPDDVFQADEYWWQSATANGAGRVFVSDVQNQGEADAATIEIAVPIYGDGTPGSSVLGVLKITLDVPRTLGSVQRVRPAKGTALEILDSHGRSLYQSTTARSAALSELPKTPVDHLRHFRSSPSGSFLFKDGNSRRLTAWARVQIDPQPGGTRFRMPGLYVVTSRNAALAFGPLWNVQFWMLIIGLVTVVLAVAVGSWLADVLVVRQVRMLARGMRDLARGDFEHAAGIAERLINAHSDSRNTDLDPHPNPVSNRS